VKPAKSHDGQKATPAARVEADLRERVKELRTLYTASRVLSAHDAPLVERLQRFVELLPGGWLHPDITEACLVMEGRSLATTRYRETPWMLTVPVHFMAGAEPGLLRVVLLEERPERDEGPFLREERELLEALAGIVGATLLHSRLAQLHAQTIASLGEAVLIIPGAGSGRRIAEANPAAERMFGYSREDLIGSTTRRLHVDADAFRRFGQESRRALARDGVFRGSYSMRRSDGVVFAAEQSVTLLQPEQGLAGGVVSVIRDLSARSAAEAALRESEERFRQLAEHIDHVFWIRTPGARTMEYVSPAYERVWGRSAEALYSEPDAWLHHVLPSDRRRVLESLVNQEMSGWEHEYRIIRPDGEVRWILDRAFPVRDDRGVVYRLIGIAEDITVRKQMEQRFGVLSQEISDVIYVVGTDGTVLLCSPSVEVAMGLTPAEFVGRNAFDIMHPEDREALKSDFAAVVATPYAMMRAQHRVVTSSGAIRRLESVARNLIDHPAVGGVLVTSRDVTDRLAVEERAWQAQKLEAVGRLAGGVAHDFNNILTIIRSQADLLLLEELPPHFANEIRIMQTAADRAARLTAQLLAFSRNQVLRPVRVDLREIIRGLDRILERAVGERVRIVYDLADPLPDVLVDPAQMEQVIMNLAVNARDAMAEGGTLRFTARAETTDDDSASSRPQTVLLVEDTGSGMSDDVRGRIFEPFFSTKPAGLGTGLGLAMVYGVVTQSGGRIRVDSAPGRGTTFRLTFPAAPAAEGRPDSAREPVAERADTDVPRLTGCRVLLVEDEPAVRRVAGRLLVRAGCDVDAVGSAEEGLAVLGVAEYDVLLTDLGLPGMHGRALIEQVRVSHPRMGLVAMSGHDVEAAGETLAIPDRVEFLAKPFTSEALLRSVRDAARSYGGG
jgi:PAS domain S-box-containing protein